MTLKKKKLLLSAAAGEHLSSQAELYEFGPVLALVNDPKGQIHLIKNGSHSTRKDISVHSLCDYLMDKFGVPEGGKLSAWYDDAGVLLFGRPSGGGQGACFHSAFRRLALPVEAFESCSVYPDHGVLMVSRAGAQRLQGRVAVYERGDILCLSPEPDGGLDTGGAAHSARSIASQELMAYVRQKYPGLTGGLPARISRGRVYFSRELPERDLDLTGFRLLSFRMTGTQKWVTLMRSGVVRVSAQAAAGLGDWVELRARGHLAALVPCEAGKGLYLSHSANKGGGSIASSRLRGFLLGSCGCRLGERLYAVSAEGGLIFSTQPFQEGTSLAGFRPVWESEARAGKLLLGPGPHSCYPLRSNRAEGSLAVAK